MRCSVREELALASAAIRMQLLLLVPMQLRQVRIDEAPRAVASVILQQSRRPTALDPAARHRLRRRT